MARQPPGPPSVTLRCGREALALALAVALIAACSEPATGSAGAVAWPADIAVRDVVQSADTQRDSDAALGPDTAANTDATFETVEADGAGSTDEVSDALLGDDAEPSDAISDAALADAQDTTPQSDATEPDATLPDTTPPDATTPDTTPDTTPPDTTTTPDTTPPDTTATPDTTPPDTSPKPDAVVVCIDVVAPAPVDEALLPTLQPVSAVQTVQSGGHTDDFLSNAAGDIRVGIRRDWGASIIFWGQQAAGTNTIDANDTGREVQVAFYDPTRIKQGCAWNASCVSNPATQCPNSITYLGWNPVQGGNECNAGSGVESVAHQPGLLSADVRPLFWNPDWQQQGCGNDGCSNPATQALPSDVRYVQRIRFVHSHIAEIDMTVHNLSGQDHPATLQELPTLYAAFGKFGLGNYNVLLTSEGQQVQIDEPANDGFFTKSFSSPGGWATLQNGPKNYGVGLYHENRQQSWQGWQKAGVFNNFRAAFAFGIPANGAVRARAYLMLGSAATIAGLAAWLEANLPPFGTVDAPAAEAQVSGATLHIAGWTLDNKAVASLQVEIDGVIVATPTLAVPRPDVCQVWPGYAMCSGNVGYSVDVPTAGLSPCWHLLEVRAKDTDGNVRLLGRRRFFFGG